MRLRRTTGLGFAAAVAAIAVSALILSGVFTSEAVQAPRLSLDMDPTGNSYSDPGAGGDNSMIAGTIDSCLSTAAPGNNLAHNHMAHVVIENVEDLVAWQLRLNYDGGKMRPLSVNFAPFADTLRGQNVSFQNLPIDAVSDTHREQTPGQDIPPAAPGPQSALMGSTYLGGRTFALSPDTPAKSPPDDASYSAPSGGVVASLALRVEAGNAGQVLSLDADDGAPNPPGSLAIVFTGTGTQDIALEESALGDGSHGEGVSCPAGTPPPPPLAVCRTATPLPPPAHPTARDVVIISQAGFTNDTGSAASDLHVCFSSPYSFATLRVNAPGCPQPTITQANSSINYRLDVDWGTACVDPGESVSFDLNWFCGDQFAPCNTPVVDCFQWTLSGVPMGPCSPSPETPTPTAVPTPAPVAGHDARLTKISGVPKNVRLSPGEVIADSASVVVANDSNHTETIGVYVDLVAPSGCSPNTRVHQSTVTLAAGAKTTVSFPVNYSCMDPAAVNGLSYSWTAVADHGADDLSSCGAGSLQSIGCFNALADDDEDPADSRKARTGPKVVAQ